MVGRLRRHCWGPVCIEGLGLRISYRLRLLDFRLKYVLPEVGTALVRRKSFELALLALVGSLATI